LLESRLHETTHEIATLREELNQLRALVALQSTEELEMRQSMTTTALDREKCTLQIDQLVTETSALKTKNERLEQELSKLSDVVGQHALMSEEVEQLHHRNTEQETRIVSLQQQNQELILSKGGSEADVIRLTAEVQAEIQEKEAFSKQLETAVADCTQLRRQLQLSRALNDQLKGTRSGYDAAVEDLEFQKAQLSREKEELQTRHSEITSELMAHNDELERQCRELQEQVLRGFPPPLPDDMIDREAMRKSKPDSPEAMNQALALDLQRSKVECGFQQTMLIKLQREVRDKDEKVRELQDRLSQFKTEKALFELRHPDAAPG
jgi:chromosome segregation ATPase